MMYHPVAEISRKYLSLDRFMDNKTNTGPRFIFFFKQIIIKFEYIGFKMLFKGKGINGIALVTAGIKIRLKQISQYFVILLIVKQV